jgi:hypothetical protein
MDSKTPIACSLNADDYRQRLDAVRELGAAALLSVSDRSDGAELTFRNTTRVREELTAIVQAENACCPFLDLSIGSDEDELSLTITAPREALPVVGDLVRSFQGARAQ